MSKVAILTIQRSKNYGAVLQSYALQQTINKFGLSCEILDLLRPIHTGYKSTNHNMPLEPYYKKNTNTPNKAFFYNIKLTIYNFLEQSLSRKKMLGFQQFEQMNLTFSQHSFCCSDDLYLTLLDYDYYVTGSDQVWNPTFPYSPEPYFLTFVPQGVPRIAYAPSFGVSEIHEAIQSQYKQWINGITHLSIRERQGADIIYQLTGRNALTVLDPTFLLTGIEWEKIAKKPNIKCQYIFCYSLGDVSGLMDLCYYVQEITGYPIYKIGNCKDLYNRRVKAILNADPQEFIGLIMDAAIVITNSFHGTAFSINMKKNFYTFTTSALGTDSRNSRLISLLDLFGLSKRLINSIDELPLSPDFDVAYDEVSTILSIEREKSHCYLYNCFYCN